MSLGRTTVHTADQIAEGQLALSKAGFDHIEVNKAIAATSNLASAADLDMATASNILVTALRGFRMEADEAVHVADVLALTMSESNTTIEEMGEAFSYVAPVAKSLGFTIEHVSAMIGVLADAGIKGSMAGTGLRRVMSALAEEIETHGVGALDNWINAQHTVSEDLLKFGLRGFNITQVLSAMREKMIRMGESALSASDVVKRMAEIRMDTLQGDMTKLESAISGFKIILGDELEPTLRAITQTVTKLVNAATLGFREWISENDMLIFSVQELEIVVEGLLFTTQLAVANMINYFNEAIREARLLFNIGEILGNALTLLARVADGDLLGTSKDIFDIVEDARDAIDTIEKGWFGAGAESSNEFFEKVIENFRKSQEDLKNELDSRKKEINDSFLETMGVSPNGIAQIDKGQAAIIDKMHKFQNDINKELDFPGWEQWEIDAQLALDVLHKIGGEGEAISNIWDMIDMKRQLDQIKEMSIELEKTRDRAQNIFDSVMTPSEIFARDKAELEELFKGGFLSDETMERALNKLKKTLESAEGKLELGVDTKKIKEGITEGLSTALGTIKIAGEVDRSLQIAKSTLSVQQNMNTLTTAIKQSANTTANALSGIVKTEIDGLESSITNGINSAIVNANVDNTALEELTRKNTDVNKEGFLSVVDAVKSIANKSSNVLT